jgi:hypothetical protein
MQLSSVSCYFNIRRSTFSLLHPAVQFNVNCSCTFPYHRCNTFWHYKGYLPTEHLCLSNTIMFSTWHVYMQFNKIFLSCYPCEFVKNYWHFRDHLSPSSDPDMAENLGRLYLTSASMKAWDLTCMCNLGTPSKTIQDWYQSGKFKVSRR